MFAKVVIKIKNKQYYVHSPFVERESPEAFGNFLNS